jgi:hypothetical protein
MGGGNVVNAMGNEGMRRGLVGTKGG